MAFLLNNLPIEMNKISQIFDELNVFIFKLYVIYK